MSAGYINQGQYIKVSADTTPPEPTPPSPTPTAAVKLDTQIPCLNASGDVVIMYDSDGNILEHKSDIGSVAALTWFAMYELRNLYLGETCPFNTSDVNAEQVSSIYIDGDGYLAYNDVDDPTGENPRTLLEWNSLSETTIDFASIAGYPRYT